jgi:hypothetical protein
MATGKMRTMKTFHTGNLPASMSSNNDWVAESGFSPANLVAVALSMVCRVLLQSNLKVAKESAYLETALCAEVDLNVDKGAIVLAPLEGVSRVAVLMLETGRSSAVGEENHDLMNGLWVLGKVVL